jgi:exopolysaccharide production protein ExoZ
VRGKLNNIQGLRASAAILVVLSHAELIGARYGFDGPIMRVFSGAGEIGVQLFFVISGFIISYSTKTDDRPIKFAKKRLTRIYPIYAVLTVAFFLIAATGVAGVNIPGLSLPWLGVSLLFGSQALLGTLPVLYVGWTLEYEALFYLLFGVALFVRAPRARAYLITAVLLALIATEHIQTGALCFIIGMAANKAAVERQYADAAGLVVASVAVTLLFRQDASILQLCGWVALAALVGLVAALPQLSSRFAGAVLLGDASYSIYLSHVFSLPIASRAMDALHVSGDAAMLAASTGATIGGVLCYLALERPMIRAFRSAPRTSRAASLPGAGNLEVGEAGVANSRIARADCASS